MSDNFKYLHTTEVPVATTASQMMSILGIIGASNISMEMADGEPSGMTFTVILGERRVTYRMPVRWQPIFRAMEKEAAGKRRARWTGVEERQAKVAAQAKRTAWRLALEWLKVQCAYVQNGIRHPAEVFLADMVVVNEGVETTVGQLCIERGGLPLIGHGGSHA